MGNSNLKPLPNKKLSNIKEPIRLFVFSWNSEAINYQGNETDLKFIAPMLDKLLKSNCNLAVFCFQEELNKSTLVPTLHKVMNKIGFVMPRETGTNIGAEHELQGLGKASFRHQTIPLKRGLKMVIFAQNKWWNKIKSKYTHIQIKKEVGTCGNWFKREIYRGKGYTIVRILLPYPYGSIAFANIHNLFSSDSIKKNIREERDRWLKENPNSNSNKRLIYKQAYINHRIAALKEQVNCLEQLMIQIKNDDVQFIVGDLNFRIVKSTPFPLGNENKNKNKKLFYVHPNTVLKKISTLLKENDRKGLKQFIIDHDELWLAKRKNELFNNFEEGVNNMGPQFLPTCKMLKGRDHRECQFKQSKKNDEKEIEVVKKGKKILMTEDDCYKFGTLNHRIPSWCDRILYRTIHSAIKVDCKEYNRYDGGGWMSKSDHAAVYGVYQLSE